MLENATINTDWINQMIPFDDFFVKGYILYRDPLIDVSKFDHYDFPDCTDTNENIFNAQISLKKTMCQQQLKEIHQYLSDNYVSKIFKNFEMKEFDIWNGVDEGSIKWHNDYEDGDPFNSTFLIYLDDNTPENGNFIAIRSPDCENILYPKRGDFVWLNQKKIFQHKAKHQSGKRRLLGFEFFIDDLI